MKPIVVFDLHQGRRNPIIVEGVKSDLRRIEDFYIRASNGQLYNAINVCEDTPANRALIKTTCEELHAAKEKLHVMEQIALKGLGVLK